MPERNLILQIAAAGAIFRSLVAGDRKRVAAKDRRTHPFSVAGEDVCRSCGSISLNALVEGFDLDVPSDSTDGKWWAYEKLRTGMTHNVEPENDEVPAQRIDCKIAGQFPTFQLFQLLKREIFDGCDQDEIRELR